MEVLVYLIPAALLLGLAGLGAFFWAMKSGQFDDLDGAAMRVLIEDDERAATEREVSDDGEGASSKRNPAT